MVEFLRRSFFAFAGPSKLQGFYEPIPSLPNMKPGEINKINLKMTHLLNEKQAFYVILVISSDTAAG